MEILYGIQKHKSIHLDTDQQLKHRMCGVWASLNLCAAFSQEL